ncbi:hypothetical protein BU26DRAFT_562072 [Trematosphaeria pertusa]|uniref:Azaphilone pigments biosynthesis cluster protein L N-terminal domain-containing protein n=1 Tax=Trematosphaeria pertusa TaxID=390896 RepID=A0A6A6IP70_9PLEO|nr:uncharacterized protein BU26DRAFT_562072 [Trematosphaeria pertusa]KAF2252325.1 hypothetical protein BU26DRAFT_562072 [Trematosphaeria pertusa]
MDPLSVTAGVIAVVGLAAKTCEGLYSTVERISEAPKDLQQHLACIQHLRSTFDMIAQLENEESFTPEFIARLEGCMHDLQHMEQLAHSFNERLQHGRMTKRAWTRIRLSLGDQRRDLRNQLSRVESYHRAFSLDLLALNM